MIMNTNKKILNAVFICFGSAMAVLIVVMLLYTYFKNEREDAFQMTKQEFAALQDDELSDAAYAWIEKYDPVIHGKQAYNKAPKAVQNTKPIVVIIV
jgi:hypothetical protein